MALLLYFWRTTSSGNVHRFFRFDGDFFVRVHRWSVGLLFKGLMFFVGIQLFGGGQFCFDPGVYFVL